MSVDFFRPECQERRNISLFGLCDDQNGQKAYTKTDNQCGWIATVRNDRNRELVFTAIDSCIIRGDEHSGQRRCDCMLTSEEHFFFIELKDQAKSWIKDASEQLEATIQIYIENHGNPHQRHRKAFACNRKHPHFHETDNERNKEFFTKCKFRIDVQAEIIII